MKKISKKMTSFLLLLSMIMTSFGMISVQAEETKDLTRGLVPLPLQYEVNEGMWTMSEETAFYVEGRTEAETAELADVAEYLAGKLRISTGFALEVNQGDTSEANNIVIKTDAAEEALGEEGYKIEVTSDGVTVAAYQPAGAFRAMQTLRQLLPKEAEMKTLAEGVAWDMPCTSIEDKPEYAFRSAHLDVSRHFFTVEEVKQYIDHMAQYKMNKLHMHLTDDQGWRIEIKGEMYGESLSKLISVGASTSADINGIKPGYYTQEDFKEIVAYAADRYIEIIPEMDMPAHAWAALVSLNFLNSTADGRPQASGYDNTKPYEGIDVGFASLECRNEKTYEFIEEVIKQISAISPSKYFHIGGDEAHSTSSSDYTYFVNRVTEIAKKYGKTPIAWQNYDGSVEDKENTVTQYWKRGTGSFKEGIKYVVSPADHAYLDMKYDSKSEYGLSWAGMTSIQKAYSWDPTDYGSKDQVVGVEACLWAETTPSLDSLEYLAYPRMACLAEVAWTPKELRNWSDFVPRLVEQGDRLEYQGIDYYKDANIWTEPVDPINAEWNIDEGIGSVITDKNGAYTGTLGGGAGWAKGFNGYGIKLDGSGYVDFGFNDFYGAWTASMWVNKGVCEENNAVLLSGVEGEIKIEQYKNTKKVGITKFGVADHKFDYTAPQDEWVLLTFVCDERYTSLYVNGVLTDTLEVAINAPVKRLGANDKAGLSSAGYFTGYLDEVKVFDRALTDEEVMKIYTDSVNSNYDYVLINDTMIGTENNQFNYVGAWRTSKGYTNRFHEGDEHWFNWTKYVEGDVHPYVTMTFDGNGIELYGNKDSMMGIYEITIDDGEPIEVDAYNSTKLMQQQLFAVYGLSEGTHTITMQSTQRKNEASSACDIEIDYAKVIYAPVPEVEFAIVKQPEPIAVQKGKDAVVTVEATGKDLTYQWFYKNPGNKKFYESASQFVNEDGASYSIPMSAWRDGQEVYCVITDANGDTLQSNTVTLTMDNGSIQIIKQPTDAIVEVAGDEAVVTVEATGEGLTYEWYYKNPGNKKFYVSAEQFVSEDGASYHIPVKAWRDGEEVYCVITDVNGISVQTNTVTLSIAK